MYGKYDLGKKVQSFEVSPASEAYSGVIVYISEEDSASEDETLYASYGDISDSSRVLELTAPICTSTDEAAKIAKNIYNSIKNKQYIPFSAGNADLPPIYGLGDSVTIDDTTVTIAKQSLKMDSMNVSDISAPSEEDIENEIEYVSQTDRKIQRQLSNQNEQYTELKITADGISSKASTAYNRASCQYGTCTTAAGTAAKVVTCENFELYTGATIAVNFSEGNTAETPTLNVNGTGAKYIYAYGSAITAKSSYNWTNNSTVYFTYNGSNWELTDSSALNKLSSLSTTVESHYTEFTQTSESIQAYVSSISEKLQHDYCVNGDFEMDTIDLLGGGFYCWERNCSSLLRDGNGTHFAKLVKTSGIDCYIKQSMTVGSADSIKIRFKALTYTSDLKPVIKCVFNSTSKSTEEGAITANCKTFEFDFENVATGNTELYLYNITDASTVLITDVEVISEFTSYAEAMIQINADSIESCVTKDGFGTQLRQSAEDVILAFNAYSNYVQISSNENTAYISLYNGTVDDSELRTTFDENGNHFWRDGKELGLIGTTSRTDDEGNVSYGLSFYINSDTASYMNWTYGQNGDIGYPFLEYRVEDSLPHVFINAELCTLGHDIELNYGDLYFDPKNSSIKPIKSIKAGGDSLNLFGGEALNLYAYDSDNEVFNDNLSIKSNRIDVYKNLYTNNYSINTNGGYIGTNGGSIWFKEPSDSYYSNCIYFTDSSFISCTNDGSLQIYVADGDNNSADMIQFTAKEFCIACYTDIYMNNFSILNSSDERLKENIVTPDVDPLEIINDIELKQFDWRESGEHVNLGMIAQQVKDVLPEAVSQNSETGLYSLRIGKFIPYLIGAVQELSGNHKRKFDKYKPNVYTDEEIKSALEFAAPPKHKSVTVEKQEQVTAEEHKPKRTVVKMTKDGRMYREEV